MAIGNVSIEGASGFRSIVAVRAFESPRPGWIMHSSVYLKVNLSLESLFAARVSTLEQTRVLRMYSDDMVLQVHLARDFFPALITSRRHIGLAVLPPHMREQIAARDV